MQGLIFIVETIFYKVIYMSIIASFVGVAILTLRGIFKKYISPKWISLIWLIFIITLIIPIQIKSNISIYNIVPINFEKIEYINQYNTDNPENAVEVNGNVETAININDDVKQTENIEKSNKNIITLNIRKLLPVFWGFIVISLFMAYILTYIVFEKRIHNSKFKDERLQNILIKCKSRLSVDRKITLIKQNIIKMPSIFGIFNVRILLSEEISKMNDKEIEYIFLHELSHYKRKDNVLNILITILRCIHFFNPIIWLLLNQVKKDLELATDELAMENKSKEEQKEYSKTLVYLSTMNSDKFLIQTMCLSDDRKNLERRIDSMKLINKFKEKRKIIAIISLVIIALIVGIFCTKSNNYMSPKDIEKVMHKAGNCKNVHYVKETTRENWKTGEKNQYCTEYYFKDDIVYEKNTKENGEINLIRYINYNTNEGIYITNYDNDEKRITIEDISNVEEKNRISKFWVPYSQYSASKKYDGNFTYEYFGVENINGKEAYRYTEKLENEYEYQEGTCWIDREKGVILKTISKLDLKKPPEGSSNSLDGAITTETYSYEFDNVTDENIKRPNLEEFADYTIENTVYRSIYY